MKRSYYIFFACCLICTVLSAKNSASSSSQETDSSSTQHQAVELLKNAADAYQQSNGVAAAFSIKSKDSNGLSVSGLEGRISLQGTRFYVEVPDEMKAWFDGRNLWTYLPNVQEVNLSTPSQEDLLMLNPVNVFMLYQHGYRCQRIGDKKSGNKTLIGVEMRPEAPQGELKSIRVYFDKQNLQPVSISIANSNATVSEISITQYQTNQNYPDSQFLFPQKDYPTVEVIDLR